MRQLFLAYIAEYRSRILKFSGYSLLPSLSWPPLSFLYASRITRLHQQNHEFRIRNSSTRDFRALRPCFLICGRAQSAQARIAYSLSKDIFSHCIPFICRLMGDSRVLLRPPVRKSGKARNPRRKISMGTYDFYGIQGAHFSLDTISFPTYRGNNMVSRKSIAKR